MSYLISNCKSVGSLPVYPIHAKLDFHAFMGLEGQKTHLFKQ